MVRWIDVVSSACAECTHPRGRYSASPADSTVSMTGSPVDALGDRRTVPCPRLGRQGMVVHGLMHDPAFLSGHLQDEHVMHVVMRIEAAIGGRRDVCVRLHRMAQIIDGLADEFDERRPQPVQTLQHNRCARGELVEYLRGVDLVGHLGTESGRPEVAVSSQDVALLGQPNERRAHPTLGDQFVDRVGESRSLKSRGNALGSAEQRLATPVLVGERSGSAAIQRLSIE